MEGHPEADEDVYAEQEVQQEEDVGRHHLRGAATPTASQSSLSISDSKVELTSTAPPIVRKIKGFSTTTLGRSQAMKMRNKLVLPPHMPRLGPGRARAKTSHTLCLCIPTSHACAEQYAAT